MVEIHCIQGEPMNSAYDVGSCIEQSCAGSLKKLIEAIQSCKDRSWQLETVAGDIVEMLSGLESVLIKRSPEVLGQAEG